MSIYNVPKDYAAQTVMSLEQATIRCNHYKKIEEQSFEASKCPQCGQHTLAIECGSFEEGYSDFVYCENDKVTVTDEDGETYHTDCDFTSNVTKEYEPISHYYDFDEVLAFSIGIEQGGLASIESNIGCTWSEFVEKANKRLLINQ